MDDKRLDNLTWLPELTTQIHAELARLDEHQHQQRPVLESEHEALRRKREGWSESLAKEGLDSDLRTDIEGDSAKAIKRMREIEILLSEGASRQRIVEDLVDPQAILDRIERLPQVLAQQNPTLGNLELSLHIDKIICFPDGTVTLRTCKLGALTEAVDLVADGEADQANAPANVGEVDNAIAKYRATPRRRGRLRVADVEEDGVDMRALAEFAADSERFAGLGDEWFWTDTFQIPERASWAKDNAPDVLRRYQQIEQVTGKRPSQNQLAREFAVSRPTIKAALDIALGNAPVKKRGQRGKHKAPIDEETRHEIVRLHREERQGNRDISSTIGIHRNTVARVLDEWYEQRGEKRPDGRADRWSKK